MMHPTLAPVIPHAARGARRTREEREGSEGPAPFARRSAFTLIETLLALAILGLIAALIVPAMASLRWETAAEQAQAEVASAFSDARSLARAKSNPVVVTVRISPEGGYEVWGAVLESEDLGALPGAKADEDAEAPAPVRAGRRLGVLPPRCTIGAPRAVENSTGGAGADSGAANAPAVSQPEMPEPLQLAVVFPDGTAMPATSAVVLTVPQGGSKAEAVFSLAINPWFAETSFTRVEPTKPGDPEPASDASTPAPGEPATSAEKGATP